MKLSLLRANKGLVDCKPPEPMDQTIDAAYERHIETVYRVCMSLMGNKQDAEDAAQSVFVKLMESGKSFVDAEHEKAWLIVTARNHCRDLHRRWWRKKVVELDPHFIAPPDVSNIRSGEIQQSLRKLPPALRLILYLYYYEGYKVAEIGAMLKLNLNTVKTQMRKARNRLKLEIGDDWNE